MVGHYGCIYIWLLFIIAVKENVCSLEWKSEESVTYYSGFSSTTMNRYAIPEDSSEAVWSFRAFKSDSSCEDRDIDIYLQHGSLPAVSLMNMTFPDRFYLNRSNLVQVRLQSDNISIHHTVLFPLSGDWFAIALIPERNDNIRQKGLSVTCAYYMMSSVEAKAVANYVPLAVNRPVAITLNSLPDGGGGRSVWVGFSVPLSSFMASFEVKKCNVTPCSLQLSYQDHSSQLVQHNCSAVESSTCSLNLTSPLHGTQYFLLLTLLPSTANTTANTSASVEICFFSQDCPSLGVAGGGPQKCHLHPVLDRYQGEGDYGTRYVQIVNNRVEEMYKLQSNGTTFLPFVIEDHVDVGGTLLVQIILDKKHAEEISSHVRVCGMIDRSYFHLLSPDMDGCSNDTNALQLNSDMEQEESSKVYVPYPEQGLWVLALRWHCFSWVGDRAEAEACVNDTLKVTVKISVQACVEGSCSGHGACKVFITGSDYIVFSTCKCVAGWDGYGCTDDRNADSEMVQLLDVLLLTLSNLFFLPAIGLSLYRRYYVEAMVYFYNMFFSTFYHACDGNRIAKYIYCMTEYSVLSSCDFLGSSCSLWVTLIAMAQLPVKISLTLQMLGPLTLIVGVLLDKTSLYLIAVPAGAGILIILISWAIKCRLRRKCFPAKRRYLCMLPGVLIALTGAVLFAFLETEANYMYVHSAWHVALSLCIIFLLPPRLKEKGSTSLNFNDTESEQALVLGPQAYNRRMQFEL